MEACCGAHHLGRILVGQGHDVRLIPPQYVKPFVKSQKNDLRDAEAIGEAVQRPTMRFVPLKTMEQLDLQAIHRPDTRWPAPPSTADTSPSCPSLRSRPRPGWNRRVKLPHRPAFVHQRLLDDHTGVAIQHRNRLLARM
jgi:hypothetical protein